MRNFNNADREAGTCSRVSNLKKKQRKNLISKSGPIYASQYNKRSQILYNCEHMDVDVDLVDDRDETWINVIMMSLMFQLVYKRTIIDCRLIELHFKQ